MPDVSLKELVVHGGDRVPHIVQSCCQSIEAMGLLEEGIYRKSGLSSKVEDLFQRFFEGTCRPNLVFSFQYTFTARLTNFE